MFTDYFKLKKLGVLTQEIQIILLTMAYLGSVYVFRNEQSWHIIFAPLYEEMIFRGFVLVGLLKLYGTKRAILLSSFLFGIWHLKNFTFMPLSEVLYQSIYTGLVLGPILATITLKHKSIWPSVLIHALNNIVLSPLSFWVLAFLFPYQNHF